MESNDRSEYIPTELFPFKRQVSGCHMVLEINKYLLCKPYFDDEGHFYENVTKDMKDFIPACYGTVDVIGTHCKDIMQFNADIPVKVLETCCSEKGRSITEYKKWDMSPQVDDKRRWDPKTIPVTWSKRRIEKFIRKWKENPIQKFLILENLLERYDRPCILDVKLGKSKRGIYESEAQKLKKEGKNKLSTAPVTSFSIGGVQVFNSDKEIYIHHGKEHCRALKVENITDEFLFFFTERAQLRCDVILEIIQKLEKLHKVLSRHNGFYFYSSSLLVIYDRNLKTENDDTMEIKKGNDGKENVIQNGSLSLYSGGKYCQTTTSPVKADVRLIDFTHSIDKNILIDKFDGNTTEILDGISNMIKYLNQIML